MAYQRDLWGGLEWGKGNVEQNKSKVSQTTQFRDGQRLGRKNVLCSQRKSLVE